MPANLPLEKSILLKNEMENNLKNNILPFWMQHTLDTVYGGFIGGVTMDNRPVPERRKAAVICARMLWTFSSAYRILKDEAYWGIARRAYEELTTRFWDETYGGVYWALDYTGAPADTTKHIYAQSFALYGLCEWYRAAGEAEALEKANALFDVLENQARDAVFGGYYEAFSRDWQRLPDSQMLAENTGAVKTMNSHLHLMEAFTNLARVRGDALVHDRLTALFTLMTETIISPGASHMGLFFDAEWHCFSRAVSFGHDIEASWLIYEAAEVLNLKEIEEKAKKISLSMAEAVFKECFRPGFGIIYEAIPGEPDSVRGQFDWWVQAEAVVGFYNAYQLSKNTAFLDAAYALWLFIDQYLVDHEHGEWGRFVTPDLQPPKRSLKADEWKCPYHNSRACFEIFTRVNFPTA